MPAPRNCGSSVARLDFDIATNDESAHIVENGFEFEVYDCAIKAGEEFSEFTDEFTDEFL